MPLRAGVVGAGNTSPGTRGRPAPRRPHLPLRPLPTGPPTRPASTGRRHVVLCAWRSETPSGRARVPVHSLLRGRSQGSEVGAGGAQGPRLRLRGKSVWAELRAGWAQARRACAGLSPQPLEACPSPGSSGSSPGPWRCQPTREGAVPTERLRALRPGAGPSDRCDPGLARASLSTGTGAAPLTSGRTRGASARTGMAVCLGRGRRDPRVGVTSPSVAPVLLWLGSDLHS